MTHNLATLNIAANYLLHIRVKRYRIRAASLLCYGRFTVDTHANMPTCETSLRRLASAAVSVTAEPIIVLSGNTNND